MSKAWHLKDGGVFACQKTRKFSLSNDFNIRNMEILKHFARKNLI